MSKTPPSFWSKRAGFPRWLKIWLISAAVFSVLIIVAVVTDHLILSSINTIADLLVCFVAGGVLATGVLLIRWLCCWRNLRRTLFTVACISTVVALFYAEENWRGKQAWNKARQEWEARGEHFKLTEMAPPPVPDDQNFALTPLLFSCYGQMIDRSGHEIRPRNTNLVNRLDLNPFKNYDQPANATGNWREGNRTDLSVLQAYYRTMAAKTNLFPIPSQPQSPAADVLLALSRFSPTIEELRQDATLPFSRFPLEYDNENPTAILLPHLGALKKSALVLQLRALAELQNGQTDAALADVQLTLRLMDSIRTEPILISHLVRIAMLQLILQPVWEGLATHAWSESQLEALEASLAKLDFITDYQLAMHGELALMVGFANYLEQNPAKYDLFVNDLGSSDGRPENSKESMRLMITLMHLHLVPSGWFDRSRLFCAKLEEENYLPAANVAKHSFTPALAMQGDALATNDWRQFHTDRIFTDISYPHFGRAMEKFALGQSSADLARGAVALERYRLAQGSYPDSLAALTPQFLDQVPVDVIGGQTLHYRRTADGEFILYSVGWNETDDGGVRGSTPFTGDWVWSYSAR